MHAFFSIFLYFDLMCALLSAQAAISDLSTWIFEDKLFKCRHSLYTMLSNFPIFRYLSSLLSKFQVDGTLVQPVARNRQMDLSTMVKRKQITYL